MRVAILMTDAREMVKRYHETAPLFGTAPEALLQGFARIPEIEVHVVSCLQQPVPQPKKIANNIWFHTLHVPKIGWMRTGYQGCIRAIRKKLKEIQPDIVHGQGTERECAISAVFSGFPNVVTIHGNMAELARLFRARIGSFAWIAAQLENFTLRRTNGVFCNSSYTEQLVRHRTRHTWRVPNAIREAFFSPLPQSVQPIKCVLINVGVISERKRQLEILQMAQKLHDHHLHFELIFIGHAPDNLYTTAFLQELKLAEQQGYARFPGTKTTAELIAQFDQASALIHFPIEEAFGLVVAEALARNLKFFGARVGGIVDIASSLPKAELFSADDWDGLSNALANWIRSGFPKPVGVMNHIESQYSPLIIARRHVEIYCDVLSNAS